MVTTADTTAPGAPAAENKAIYGGGTPAGAAARRFRIAFDVVAAATSDLPDRDREALRWLAQYGRAKNLTHDEVASRLKKPDGSSYSGDSVYQALTGRREADQLGNLVEAVAKFREIEEARAGQVETGFIETAISRRVFGACRKAFLRRKIVFLWGESQIGKTTALVQYTLLHNHGETVYVRMPTGGSIDGFLHALAEVLGIPTGNRGVDLQRRIMASFDDRMLLIVDEAHEALSEHYSAKRGLRTLNWVRELQERCKCGVVLSATNVFRDVMLRGPHARNLRQLWLRGMAPVQLPDRPCNADLDAFARAYGLGPATDEEVQVRVAYIDDDGGERQQILAKNPCVLQAEVIRAYSLGRWNVILQEASDIARERKRPLTWGLVIHAWHSFERMGQFDQGGAS